MKKKCNYSFIFIVKVFDKNHVVYYECNMCTGQSDQCTADTSGSRLTISISGQSEVHRNAPLMSVGIPGSPGEGGGGGGRGRFQHGVDTGITSPAIRTRILQYLW